MGLHWFVIFIYSLLGKRKENRTLVIVVYVTVYNSLVSYTCMQSQLSVLETETFRSVFQLASLKWNGASFNRLKWNGASFSKLKWNGASFSSLKLNGASFSRLKWNGASFSSLKWNGASFSRLKWNGASFSRLKWNGALFNRLKWNLLMRSL